MLHISDISFRHGERVLFDRASAAFSDGWKVGLVGRNGAGKSTLLRLIQRQIEADSGEINLMGRTRVGSVPQDPPGGDIRVIDAVLAADVERSELLAEDAICQDGVRLAEIHARLEEIGAAAAPSRAASILNGLGFDNEKQSRPCGEFSGGWRMRVALAGTLFSSPDLLILDEPSNHLDVEAMIWLTEYLKRFRNTVLMVSHDRDLLNDVCDHIVHIDQQKLVAYTGNYDFFERTRAERLANDAAQQAKVAAQRKHMQAFVDRFKAKASKARQAQSRMKMIEKLGPVASVPIDERISFNFPSPEILASPIETLDDVSVGYPDGPLVLRHLDLRIDMEDRIALLGQNGNGKSTFIRLLSQRLEPREGQLKKTPKLRVGYFSQDQEEGLDFEATPFDHMARALGPGAGEAKVRAQLGRFGFSRDRANLKVGVMSGGEKTRLLLALATRTAPHMLLLDEPTNHLDMDARASLVDAINDFEGAVVLVSHDTHLVKMVADALWVVQGGTVKAFDGDIDEYQAKLLKERGARPPKAEKTADAGSKKDQRKAAADNRTNKAPLKKAVDSAEKMLARLTEQLNGVLAKLADPAIYAGPGSVVTELQKEKARLEREVGNAEKRWLAAQEALEAAA
ncbi:ABC-F family ATP-binding cassette domain-containing protein [Reyranella sp.]|jgi:ATP-binding cassette subfamily F protein 3|uniref:ABC-F family ATP-binding cassette domain-containing protein n=1 Tax=Reyranella sp. TaxID=1929291 RepID=UPI000BC5BA1E|nr:ABC-F family ATP-binding cassette domain-containing protein [Reyranella sp.]OYY46197.1 MAG: glycosyl transferase family 1 [Rhodospirillales bacterium 35-66-84]OYZ96578.1 MAG: glycosyl transferase family 1 [Rhodospirillales bacterium 24-66-33]OZB28688.1 MAG: glycosyl transferase family 1 [Rhodospirillales bacterium 39-66-50]